MGNVIPYCIPYFYFLFFSDSPWRRGPRGQKGATATSVPLFFVLLGRAGGLSCTAGRVGCHACRGEGDGWNSAPRRRAGARSEPRSQLQESRRGASPRGVLAVVSERAALKTVQNWPLGPRLLEGVRLLKLRGPPAGPRGAGPYYALRSGGYRIILIMR